MGLKKQLQDRHFKELYGFLYLALGVFFGLCLLSYNPTDPAFNSASDITQISNLGGIVGAYLADILFTVLGISAYVFCAALILLSIMLFMGKTIRVRWNEVIAYTILVIAASTLIHLRFDVIEINGQPISGGGFIGGLFGVILKRYLNSPGAYTVAAALFVVSFFYATHISLKTFLRLSKNLSVFLAKKIGKISVILVHLIKETALYVWPGIRAGARFIGKLFTLLVDMLGPKEEVIINKGEPSKLRPKKTEELLAEQKPVKPEPRPEPTLKEEFPEVSPKIFGRIDINKKRATSQLELAHISKDYEFPPLSLLDSEEQKKIEVDEDALKKNAVMLIKKLKDYGVEGKVTEIHPGPVITMYEFEPAAGVKINKIVNLADDLAVAMGGRSIRVVPHLPGKAAIGIEIPNHERETVWLKDILSDIKFAKSQSRLTLALGKNTQGLTTVSDLGKMPHLLIAGATGSGKSVAINTMILSFLYKATPEEVRMIMIDPKTLELPGYNGIPHLLLPVVTDPRKASLALQWALREMERRYKLMSEVGAKGISTYNEKIKGGELKISSPEEAAQIEEANPEAVVHTGTLPFIVIIVDELADLMMVASKDFEECITRLAQMARAAGIHLIIATQRPSVDVITGLIKANFPTRVSFKVSSKHDSRTILDGVGAEHLLGYGDMLFMPPNSSNIARLHGALVTEEEIERVVNHLKEQGQPCYDETILQPQTSVEEYGETEYDELYDTAVKIVAETRQASISMIQRRLRIGYNRAARMIERMEAEGIVGPQDGSKPRDVLVSSMGSTG